MSGNINRRDAIKKIGSLTVAGGALAAGTGTATAQSDSKNWNFIYGHESFKDSKGFVREVDTIYGSETQSFNFGVQAHVAEKTGVGDYRIVVDFVESGMTARNDGSGSGISMVYGNVNYWNGNAFYFREDEDWMAIWHPDATGEKVTYGDYAEAFVDWGLGELESYITEKNPLAAVLSSAADLIKSLAAVGNPSSEDFQANFYDRKQQVHAYRRFELRLDPKQEVSFEVSMQMDAGAKPDWDEFSRDKTPVFERQYTISAPPEDPYPTIG